MKNTLKEMEDHYKVELKIFQREFLNFDCSLLSHIQDTHQEYR